MTNSKPGKSHLGKLLSEQKLQGYARVTNNKANDALAYGSSCCPRETTNDLSSKLLSTIEANDKTLLTTPVDCFSASSHRTDISASNTTILKGQEHLHKELNAEYITPTHVPVPVDVLDPTGTHDIVERMLENEANIYHEASSHAEDIESCISITGNPYDANKSFDLSLYLRHQMEEHQVRGNNHPEMGLAFRDLRVEGYGMGSKLSEDFLSTLALPFRLPSIIKSATNPHIKEILKGIDGCVKPGEMLLVLGRPGSGCTTFLKSLASYRDGYKAINGDVLYEGFTHHKIDGPLRGEVVYAPEDDVHFPTLSTKNTLDFAVATRAPRRDWRVTYSERNTRKEYISLFVEMIATVLGLRHTYNTFVGNSFVRGVSGGERKRVSIGEVLATRARIMMFDNSSRGLDSSTALEFVQALRIATDLSRATTISSIYQAGESITQTFDKVMVLNDGYCVYYGPVAQASDYFKSIGYLPHNRQTTADFLVACTDPAGRRLNREVKDIPLTPESMAEAFRTSAVGQANRRETDEYMAKMQSRTKEDLNEHVTKTRSIRTKRVPERSSYVLSWPQQVRLAIKRRAQVTWGDRETAIIMALASLFQALIMGSLYFQMNSDSNALFSRSGVMFFALLYNSFMAMSDIPNNYMQRPILIRQQRFAMLQPSSDAIGATLLDIPVRAVTLTAFNVVLYFMSGLSYDAGKFFIFYFTVLLCTYTMIAIFRMLTAVFHSPAAATMIAGLLIIDFALYTGFAIPRPNMVVWWRWLSYCNPVSFAYEILLTNEFRGRTFTCSPGSLVPSGGPYNNVPLANKVCAIAGAKPGTNEIDTSEYLDLSYGYKWENADRDAGIVIAFWIFSLILYMLASDFMSDPAARGGIMVYMRGKIHASDLEKIEVEGTEAVHAEERIDAEELQKKHDTGAHLDVSRETFSWEHVNYDVLIKGSPRRLLDDVSGFVAPGKMTALMGESGAGKTTLLNVLAQRVDTGVVRGDFLVNGCALPRSFQADTGYCQQQDVHVPQQTVREALRFSAMLRQPRETPKEERLAYVETVIKLLEMESFAEAMVGGEGEGLNVEQRKRLTIGVELAAKPSLLLFLDEPTSGLDAQAAWSVVRFLKKLANEGQAILCTIHQPSGELFNQFDRLLLLQKGGRTAYFGELGPNSSTLINYFEKRSGILCGENANPAEYILDVIGAGATATTDKNWFQLYRESELYAEMQEELARVRCLKDVQGEVSETHLSQQSREYAQPFVVQFAQLMQRTFMAYWRDPSYILSKLMLNIVGGLFIGSSFWGKGTQTSLNALQNKLFASFMILVITTALAQQIQPVFIDNRSIFEVREKPSKLYSWVVFLLVNALVEIPWNFLGGTLFWVPWYFMVHFGFESSRVGYSWGLYMIFQIYYSTLGQALATFSPNALVASVLFATMFSFIVLFCGVVQPPSQMPYFWHKWMYHLSPFTYLVEGLMGNTVHDQEVRCEPNEFNILYPPHGSSCDEYLGDFTVPLSQVPKPESPEADGLRGSGYYIQGSNGICLYCPMRRGEDYLTSISMSSSYRFRDIGILAAYAGFNLLTIFVLYYLSRVVKWRGKKIVDNSKTKEYTTASSRKDRDTRA